MAERHKLGVGSVVKVGKITTRTDTNGLPMWSFYVPFVEQRNGEFVAYDFLQLCVRGKCDYETGELVRVVEIESYYSTQYRNQTGGFAVSRSVWCKVEGVKK